MFWNSCSRRWARLECGNRLRTRTFMETCCWSGRRGGGQRDRSGWSGGWSTRTPAYTPAPDAHTSPRAPRTFACLRLEEGERSRGDVGLGRPRSSRRLPLGDWRGLRGRAPRLLAGVHPAVWTCWSPARANRPSEPHPRAPRGAGRAGAAWLSLRGHRPWADSGRDIPAQLRSFSSACTLCAQFRELSGSRRQ